MFWKFNLITTSHIETLLKKENVTLQELMDEEDILQECKAQNKALIEFLTHPDVMAEMVNLVISEPPEDLDEKVRYKYSNIASELLTSDVPQINECLASDKALLNKLYSFIEKDAPLNPLLASFFSKTMGILISRKTEATFEFIQTKDFVNQIMYHLRTSAIMDLLLRLVTCPENAKLRSDILQWLDHQQTVFRLMSLMDPSVEEGRHCNASQALCDIVRMARERHNQMQEKLEADPLVQTIESPEAITKLLDHVFSRIKCESSIINGVFVLLALLEVKKCGLNTQQQQQQQQQQSEQSSIYFRPEAQEPMTPQDEERLRQGLQRTVKAILPRVKHFHELLLDPPKKSPIQTTVGMLDPPLGSTRIHVSRLISSLVFANVHEVNLELDRLGTIQVLLDLFFQYSWNNFLHTQVEQCIGTILANESTTSEDGKSSHPLLDNLFVKCGLIQRILGAWEDNEAEEARIGGHRRGYMGHLTAIANHVVLTAEKGVNKELIEQRIKELPEEIRQKWEAFTAGILSDINKKNLVTPVGAPSLQLSPEDDVEANTFPHETALQQAFSDYQMQQMTSNFIDQFGFDDEDFGEHEDGVNVPLERLTSVKFNISAEEDARRELFEQACNERIQPLESTDSDEDIWEDKEQEMISVVKARPYIGTALNRRTTRVGSDQSTDSEEEDDSKPIPVMSSTPSPAVEVKMDVDQGEATWTAHFDTVPMDTGNPWESPSQAEATSMVSNVRETGWADFTAFTDFGSSVNYQGDSNNARLLLNSPVSMETSEIVETPTADPFAPTSFKECIIDQHTKGVRPSNSGHSKIPCPSNGDEKPCSSISESTATGSAEDTRLAYTSDRAECSRDPSAEDQCDMLKRDYSDNPTASLNSPNKHSDLAGNFEYLRPTGMIPAPVEPSEHDITQNGPSRDASGSGSSRRNGDDDDAQSKVEETRAKALEVCEQYAAVVGMAPNGPV